MNVSCRYTESRTRSGTRLRVVFPGALPPDPRLPPLLRRLTPKGKPPRRTNDLRIRTRNKEQQKELDNTITDGILQNQVAHFSMNFRLTFR